MLMPKVVLTLNSAQEIAIAVSQFVLERGNVFHSLF